MATANQIKYPVARVADIISDSFWQSHAVQEGNEVTLAELFHAFFTGYNLSDLLSTPLQNVVAFPPFILAERVDYSVDLITSAEPPEAIGFWLLSLAFERDYELRHYSWEKLLEYSPRELHQILESDDWTDEDLAKYLVCLALKVALDTTATAEIPTASEPAHSAADSAKPIGREKRPQRLVTDSSEEHQIRKDFTEEIFNLAPPETLIEHIFSVLHQREAPLFDTEIVDELSDVPNLPQGPEIRHELNTNVLIQRTERTRYGLRTRDTRTEEYTAVADAIIRELHNSGGVLHIESAARKFAQQFGIRLAVVENYLQLPLFMQTGEVLRARADDEEYFVDTFALGDTPGAFVFGDSVSYLFPVTFELLVGGALPIPEVIAGAIGLHPFSGPSEITISGVGWTLTGMWEPTNPYGPLLYGISEAMIRSGFDAKTERLRIEVSPDTASAFMHRVPSDLSRLSRVEQLQLLTGSRGRTVEEIEQDLPAAMNIDEAMIFGGIASRLAVRGDVDIAELLR